MGKKLSLSDIRIGKRLNFVLGSIVVFIIGLIGIVALYFQYTTIVGSMEAVSYGETENFKSLIEREIGGKQDLVNTGMKVAEKMFYSKELVFNKDNQIEIAAINQETKEQEDIVISQMIYDDSPIYHNYNFVDELGGILNGTATIFQKIPQGYLRISTNVKNKEGERGVNTFIPNSSPVIKAIEKGKAYKGRAFVVDDWYVTIYKPIINEGVVRGILYVGVKEKNLEAIKQVFASKKYLKSGYPFLISKSGEMIIHPTQEGISFKGKEFYEKIMASNSDKGSFEYNYEGEDKILYFQYVPFIESYIGISYYREELSEAVSMLFFSILGVLVIGIVVFLIVNRYVAKSITKPLRKSVEFAEKVALGDLSVVIDVDQKDEIGQMVSSMNSMVVRLKNIVSEIIRSTANIASAGQQVSSTSMQISKGANEQAASVEEVSSTMEEMVSNIQMNTENAGNTEKISNSAHEGMQEVFDKTNLSVEATNSIAQKIGVINDIAMQTNILSLNAAVEAARAGTQGKGFAVVAQEVRKLADHSKHAADEIIKLSEESLDVVKSAGEKVGDMAPEIEKTTEMIREISVSSTEQLKGAEQVNEVVQQLNNLTQQNASSSEELAASAQQLSAQAEQLEKLVNYFNLNIETSDKKVVQQTKEKKDIDRDIDLADKKSVKYTDMNSVHDPEKKDGMKVDIKLFDKDFDEDFESF